MGSIKLNIFHRLQTMGTEIEEPIKTALKEFLQWYGQRYSIDIEVDAHRLTIYIQHDITEDLEDCVFNCVQQTKRILSKEVDEEKIRESCQDSCFVETTAVVDARFDDIREELIRRLNKYGIKNVWQGGWEDSYRYLVIHVQH
jgi:hypothetical protein